MFLIFFCTDFLKKIYRVQFFWKVTAAEIFFEIFPVMKIFPERSGCKKNIFADFFSVTKIF